MQRNPIISQFSLAPPHQVTQYLTLSRLKNSQQQKQIFSQSTVNHTNEQIIVNVKKPNVHASNSTVLPNNQQGDIREDIDACLDAIEAAYAKKPIIKGQQNFIDKPSPLNQSKIREDAIHRIDSNIVMNYVKSVYKDYPIKNRFGDFNPSLNRSNIIHQQHQQQQSHQQFKPRERASSLNRPSSKQKQFLNVTQQSRMSKRQASLSSYKKQDISFINNTTKRDHYKTFSNFQSPNNRPKPSIIRAPQTTIKSQLFQKVVDDFRYCVNCQKSILSINIDFHERYQCSCFQTLYMLSFKELASFIQVKVDRIKSELKQKLTALKETNKEGESKPKIITSKIIGLIEQYLKQQQKGNGLRQQKRNKYSFFKESQNNLYSECVQLTNKLHWFQQICFKLRNEQTLTTNTSFNKVDEAKPLEVIRSIPLNIKEKRLQLTPAAYFHPHLHRYAKQSF